MTLNSVFKTPKAALVVLSMSLSITLAGCGGSDELKDPLTRDYETYIGEIKSLGGIDVQDLVTHLFETEEGEILYAYSDRYDLDSSDYSDIKVKAYGVLTTYENLDKPLFEIKQISEAPDEDETDEEVTDVEYQDPDLGFTMTYPSDWTVSVTPDSVVLSAPLAEEEETENVETTATDRDQIVIERTTANLEKTSDDAQEDRAEEVRTYVSSHYASLADLSSELTYVGPDRMLGIKYKDEDGNSFYFVPRTTELFELSYEHLSDSDSERVTNNNVFSKLLTGFQFTPYGEGDGANETDSTEETDEVMDSGTPTAEQVSFSSYRDLESKSFAFKMSYPGSWYYSGNSSGFIFNDAPIEDEATEGIITMTFSTSGTVGTVRSSDSATVTVEVGDRYYSITGPAEYEEVMETMSKSISSTNDKG